MHRQVKQPLVRRILFLTTVSFTEHAGGVVYSRAIRDALATQGAVTTAYLSKLQCHSSRRSRWLGALAKSLLTGVPSNVLFHSGNLTPAAMQLIHQEWDLVVIDHLESAFARPAINTPAIYVSHNREASLISQKMPRAPGWVKLLLSSWVERYEQQTVRSVDAVITISSDEAHWYRTLNPCVAVVPPVFSTVAGAASPATHGRLRIGFLGGANWLPNREAMDLLLTQILPHTRRPLDLVVAGGGWDAATLQAKLRETGAESRIILSYLGYIDDIAKFWSAIDVFAAPIASGAGVNVKVCEALANARPVIALPHALRGLDGIARDLVCSAATPFDFALTLDTLDPAKYPLIPPDNLTPAYAERTLARLLATLYQRATQ
jgi:polysaccharide biosynthesis protein PslH